MTASEKPPTPNLSKPVLKDRLTYYTLNYAPISIIVISLVLLFWGRANANEPEAPLDIPIPIVIEETPAPPPEQAEPEQAPLISQEPVAVIEPPVELPVTDWYDDTRLQIMSAQALSFESTGEYTQISKDAQIVDGDSITFEAVKDTLFTGKEEVHVYEAPCGRGWQVIIYEDPNYGYLSSARASKAEISNSPGVRSYGYGCDHTARTYNW